MAIRHCKHQHFRSNWGKNIMILKFEIYFLATDLNPAYPEGKLFVIKPVRAGKPVVALRLFAGQALGGIKKIVSLPQLSPVQSSVG